MFSAGPCCKSPGPPKSPKPRPNSGRFSPVPSNKAPQKTSTPGNKTPKVRMSPLPGRKTPSSVRSPSPMMSRKSSAKNNQATKKPEKKPAKDENLPKPIRKPVKKDTKPEEKPDKITQEKTDVPTKTESEVNVDQQKSDSNSVVEPKQVESRENSVSEAKNAENNETPIEKENSKNLISEIVEDLVQKATEKDQLEAPETEKVANEKTEFVEKTSETDNVETPLVDLGFENKSSDIPNVEPIKSDQVVDNGHLLDSNQPDQFENDSLNGDVANSEQNNDKNSAQDLIHVGEEKLIDVNDKLNEHVADQNKSEFNNMIQVDNKPDEKQINSEQDSNKNSKNKLTVNKTP